MVPELSTFHVLDKLGDVALTTCVLGAVTLGQPRPLLVVHVACGVDEAGVARVANGRLWICLVAHDVFSLVVSMFSRRDPTGLPTDSYQSSYCEAIGKSYHLILCGCR